MNQILVTQKIYVTPELKRKKKFYKFDFFLSVFLVCVLFSFYIYAEYDRNKNEELSKELLTEVKLPVTEGQKTQENNKTTIHEEDNIILVALEDVEDLDITILEPIVIPEQETEIEPTPQDVKYAANGEEYYRVAIIKIPKIGIEYAVLNKTSDTLLKISPTRFWGPDLDKGVFDANEVGNFCIVGHNYRNSKFFSKVPTLKIGDTIELTDMKGKTVTYALYDLYIVDQSDVSCTDQNTEGRREVTLITCTNDSKARVVAKFREI